MLIYYILLEMFALGKSMGNVAEKWGFMGAG
jgi:hypothetical protein